MLFVAHPILNLISTHAPLAGRDKRHVVAGRDRKISTHAPLAGRDDSLACVPLADFYFNPRAPCGARHGCRCSRSRRWYFNPRAPCGARPSGTLDVGYAGRFQPTRPLRGATRVGLAVNLPSIISTHAPLAGRDGYDQAVEMTTDISTHAPLAGRDRRPCRTVSGHSDFNPRAPCGARQQKCTNHYAHFCDNRQISDAFAQNAACQGILLLFDAGKPCGFWVRTAQVISAHLCFAL